MSSQKTSKSYQIAVIGLGIHGSHLAGRLVADGIVKPEQLVGIDPAGDYAEQWKRRAANCGMGYLRSPSGHGLDPMLSTLRRMGADQGDFTPPYHRPSTRLFERHLLDWTARHCNGVDRVRGAVEEIAYDGRVYRLRSDSGEVHSRVLILAPGPPAPLVPETFRGLGQHPALVHLHEHLPRPAAGSHIAIVGGGIAAAHRALGWSEEHDVQLWTRDPMSVWQFDSAPCFIGPRCGDRFRTIRSLQLRRDLIQRSRRPGSLPPRLYHHLQEAASTGRITTFRAAVQTATAAGSSILLAGADPGGRPIQRLYDLVVLATGFSREPPAAALIRQMAQALGLARAPDGFPVPDRSLAWGPGIYVSGGLAELELGPPARNIIGAHLASRRIIPAIANELGRRPGRASRARPVDGRVGEPSALQT